MRVHAKQQVPASLQRRHALRGLVGRDGVDHPDGRAESSDVSAKTAPEATPEATIDWSSWYLTNEEDMGQSPEQEAIISALVSALKVLGEERGWQSVLVGYDHFFAWVEGEPLVQVSPDVFLLDDPPSPEERLPGRWETWRPGFQPPRFAVEIVSDDWKKDYAINPARYDHLGVSELVLADPDAWFQDLRHRGRAPLSVYRRNDQDRLELVYQGPGPVWSREIDAYLCFQQPAAGRVLLRVSRSADGQELVPTMEDARQAVMAAARAAEDKARAAEDKARAAEDKARAAEDKARAAEDKARAAEEARLALEAELAALRAMVQKAPKS